MPPEQPPQSIATAATSSRRWLAITVVSALVAAGFLSLWALRPAQSRLWGDESTYVAMTASLAHDRDLIFDSGDLARERAIRPPGPDGLILHQLGNRFAYSKPVLYPLLAAPVYWLLGTTGLVVFNLLALAIAFVLAFFWLNQFLDRFSTLLQLLTLLGCATLVPYVLWRMSEALVVSLVLAGLSCSLADARRADHLTAATAGLGRRVMSASWLPYFGALVLGLATSLRYPNGAIAFIPILAAVVAGRVRRALGLSAATALGFIAVAAVTWALTGVIDPYTAARSGFGPETGYPVGDQTVTVGEQVRTNPGSRSTRPSRDPLSIAYAAFYFLVGRHSGILWYFPATLAFCLAALRRPDRLTYCVLAGMGALVAFYLVWLPYNYFGGGTFVGNRYFLAAYPALLFLSAERPGRQLLALTWATGLVVMTSAVLSVATTHTIDGMSQSHANAGIFRGLPYESVAPDLDGRNDRYWGGDFVRFVDPYAQVQEKTFTLLPNMPAAEFLLVTSRGVVPLRLLVSARTSQLQLELCDWGGCRPHSLNGDGNIEEVVDFELAPAWRRHNYWWNANARYTTYAIRLRSLFPNGPAVPVVLTYIGDGLASEWKHNLEVVRVDYPTTGRPGAVTQVRVQLRNSGAGTWNSDGSLPIYLSYRLFPRGGFDEPIDGQRTPIHPPVPPGGVFDGEMTISWPQQEGSYRLVIDLVHEGVTWFEDRTGKPIVGVIVTVTNNPEVTPPDPTVTVPAPTPE